MVVRKTIPMVEMEAKPPVEGKVTHRRLTFCI